MSVTPFLKWAGGKRWLIQSISDAVPVTFNRYFEPFLGSGAIFFHLVPSEGVLADVNDNLINTYRAIKENWEEVFHILQIHHKLHSTEYYYKMRSSNFDNKYESAAQLIYLNRTCWNGLYRVNKSGKFNVPVGTKKNVILDTDDFKSISSVLSNIDIISSDFDDTIKRANYNDFVFVDPPYITNHNVNGFVKYNEKLFSWQDQVRLAKAVKKAAKRGVKITVLNANHDSLRELYKDFNQVVLTRSTVIAGKKSSRGLYDELMVRTW